MANYHSDVWIMKQVLDHHHEAQQSVPEGSRHVLGTFYQGSGNYGLDYEDSDVDTKCLIIPTLKEIALAKQPISTTHIRENNEHIDLKDVRLYLQTFRKQNLNFLEILFTKYYWLNIWDHFYTEQWKRLVDNREAIAHMDPARCMKSMKGILSEKYFAMEHHYPSRMSWIEKYGYDPKQLHHLLRVEEFISRYTTGESFEDCLISKDTDYLINVKKGWFDLDTARDVANTTYANGCEIAEKFIEQNKNACVPIWIEELLDDVGYQVIERGILNDMTGGWLT